MLLSSALTVALTAQVPGPANLTPELPPTAAVPVLSDLAAGDPVLADRGTGRGQLWVDVVGPGLTDPALPGPPDGLPDLVQFNSNSPALPLGAGPKEQLAPAIGTSPSPTAVFRREADGSLTEMAAAMSVEDGPFSLRFPGASPWGATAGDLDGDGFVDLVIANGGFNIEAPNAILLAEGDGTFRYATPAGGPAQASFVPALFDPDRDGDLDLYVGNGSGEIVNLWVGSSGVDPTDRFYRNDGSGQLVDATAESGLGLASTTFAAVTTDLDLDGTTDLVVSCFRQFNKVFYGRGDGTFAFMRPDASSAGPPLALTDLVPDPTFEGTVDFPPGLVPSLASLPIRSLWSMPVEAADFNGDGWTDLFFGTWSNQLDDDDPTSAVDASFSPWEPCFLYLNLGDLDGDGRGDGLFRSAGGETGLDHVGGVMGAVSGDFNGDGWTDVYVGGGGPNFDRHVEEDFLYLNEPTAWPEDFLLDPAQPLERAFYEVGAVAGTYVNREMCHGVNAHVGADGRLDVVVGNGGPAANDKGQPNRYFGNTGNVDGSPSPGWTVELVAADAGTGAVGARVALIRDGGGGLAQVLVAERQATHGFASQRLTPLRVPSGGAPLLFADVHWPSGRHGGRHFWPVGTPEGSFTFSEPQTSLRIESRRQPNGAVELALAATHHGAQPLAQAVVLLAVLPQGPGALATPLFLTLAANLELAPGEPWELAGTFPSLPEGLYAAVLVAGGEVLNEAACWWPGLVPASSAAASTGPLPPPDRRRWLANERIDLRAHGLVERPQDGSGAQRAQGLAGTGRRSLPAGDALRWDDGRTTLFCSSRPAWIQLEDDGSASVLLGAPLSCCEATDPHPATHLRFELEAGEPVRIDGRVVFGG